MELAVVTGSCIATIKDATLHGRKLTLVRRADAEGTTVGEVEVAIDVTDSTAGQLVLLARGSAARQSAEVRSQATDLTIVGIVDEAMQTIPHKQTYPPAAAH